MNHMSYEDLVAECVIRNANLFKKNDSDYKQVPNGKQQCYQEIAVEINKIKKVKFMTGIYIKENFIT